MENLGSHQFKLSTVGREAAKVLPKGQKVPQLFVHSRRRRHVLQPVFHHVAFQRNEDDDDDEM
jgi:hypothetical protein